MGTRWVTWIDGRAATVELLRNEAARDGRPAHVVARIEEAGVAPRELALDLHALRPNGSRWVVPVDGPGRQVRVGGETADGARDVVVGTHGFAVRAVSELDAWLGSGDDAAGSGAVTVAMPGRVVKVLAPLGSAVEKGQAVLIIEAMKMENEVKARRAGHVVVVHVAEGDSVEGGRTLMEIGD
jgi:biotin carboxyl carrier protein